MRRMFVLLLFMLFGPMALNAKTFYVRLGGDDSQDGLSWGSARRSLQSAIDDAEAGDEVWVANGWYESTDIRECDSEYLYASSFILRDGVSLYGGFRGNENSKEERERDGEALWEMAHTTALTVPSMTPGSVLYPEAESFEHATVIDGFSLLCGMAYGAGDEGCGGGALLPANAILQNCIVENNLARDGGGVATLGAACVRQCLVRGNDVIEEGWGGRGGGIACFGDGATLENSVIYGNGEACGVLSGGGVFSEGSSQIAFCTIVGNVSSRHGSGVVLEGTGRLFSSIVWGNRGGALQVAAPASTVAGSAIQGQHFAGGNIPLDESNCCGDGIDANGNQVDRYYVCFANPDIGDFRLGLGSYAINRGFVSDDSLSELDAAGNPRVQQSVPDIGAFETPYPGNLAVGFEVSQPCIYKNSSVVKPVLGLCTPDGISVEMVDLTEHSDWVEGDGEWTVRWNRAGAVVLWMGAGVAGVQEDSWETVSLTRTLTVARRPIGVSAVDVAYSYGDEFPELTYEVTAGSLAEGDRFTGELACEIEDLLETTYPITQGSLNIDDGESGANYRIIFTDGELTYRKAIASITLEADRLDYTGSNCAPDIVTEPANLTLHCRYNGTRDTPYENENAAPSDAGVYGLTVTIDDPHYAGTLETEITILPLPLQVTADDKSRMYMEANPELTLSFSGFLPGEGIEDITMPHAATTATPASLPGSYPITLSGGSARNYTLVPHEGTLVIHKATLQAAVTAEPIAYGDSVGDSTIHGSASLSFSDYEVAGSFAWLEPEQMLAKGSYSLGWRFTPEQEDRFEAISGTLSLTVNPMELSIAADSKSIHYGQEELPLTFTITEGQLVNGDSFTGTLTRKEGNVAGEYAITIGTLQLNDNYSIHFTPGTYTILRAALAIDEGSLSATSIVYGSPLSASVITGTPCNAHNGVPVAGSFAWVNPGAMLDSGTHTVECLFVADDEADYEPFHCTCTITIAKAGFGILSSGASKVYGEEDPAIPYTLAEGMPSGVQVTGAPGRAVGETVGEYELTVGSLELDNPNYAILFTAEAPFVIEPRALAVHGVAASKVCGESDPALFAYTISNEMEGDALVLSGALLREEGEAAGDYEIQLGSLALGNENYTIDYTPAIFTIEKRTVTIALKSYEIGQLDDDPVFEYEIVDGELLAGDAITGLPEREAGEYGVFAITGGTLAINDNYELIVVPGEITINKETIQPYLDSVETMVFGHKLTELAISVHGIASYSGKWITGHAEWVYPNQIMYPPKSTTTIKFIPDPPYADKTCTLTLSVPVEKARFTVKADDIIMQAGDSLPTLTYSIIDGETPTHNISGKLKLEDQKAIYMPGSTTSILRGTLTIAPYYEMEFITGTLTVTPRYITIQADDAYKYEGEADPVLTYTIVEGSLKYNSHLTGAPTRELGEEPGTYLITLENLNLPSPLYVPAYLNGTFTILPGARPEQDNGGQTRGHEMTQEDPAETTECRPVAECIHVSPTPLQGVVCASTLEEAMELVADDGEIILHPGVYQPEEGYLSINRNIHLRGLVDSDGGYPTIDGHLFLFGETVDGASFTSIDVISPDGPAVVLQEGAANVTFRNAYLQGEDIAVNAYQAGCVRFEETTLDAPDLGILFIQAPQDNSFYDTVRGAEIRSAYDMTWPE